MHLPLHDRESGPLRIDPRPHERWKHPFASITDDPLRDPPALVERLAPSAATDDPLLVARIEAVHRTLSRCGVPHVLPIRGVQRADDGGLVVVYREVLGEDLGTMLARGPVSLERAFAILRQLCRSIGRAHVAGIEHRLLGPASVIVTGRGTGPGTIEILDFGLAHVVDDPHAREDAVTLAPITPEGVLGGATDASEDVYAIGSLAFWMIAGRPPFRGEDAATLRRRHAIEDCTSLADAAAYDVPDLLVDAIDRALRKDPDERPADIAELETAIVRAQRQARIETPYDALLDGPPRVARRVGDESGGSPRPRRRRTAPLSIDPAMVDGGRGASGAAADGAADREPRRGSTLVSAGPSRPRARWPLAVAGVVLATGLLGGWWATTGSAATADPRAAEVPIEPDAPSVYASGASGLAPTRPLAPETAALPVAAPLPGPPGPAGPSASALADAEVDADAELEGEVVDDEALDEELASIVIEPDPPPARGPGTSDGASRPGDAQCSAERRAAYRARTEYRWRALLSATRHPDCWASPREPARLRVKALMELRRFEQCAKVGGKLSRPDPELARWVALCRERAKEAARGPAKEDRYAAASTQQ